MTRHRPSPRVWWAAVWLCTNVAACTSGSGDINEGGDVTPAWLEPEEDAAIVAPDVDLPEDVAVALPVDAAIVPDVEPDLTLVLAEPIPEPTLALEEHFAAGTSLHREVSITRRFRVQVQSNYPTTLEGSSEAIREYMVDVESVTGRGLIETARLTMLSDSRRSLTQGGNLGGPAVAAGPLDGQTFACQLASDGAYQCGASGDDEAMLGVTPQLTGLFPSREASLGDTWELSGRDAEIFLGVGGIEATILFVLDDTAASYQDERCYHVTYTLSGTQSIQVSGRTFPGQLTGQGEYFHCLGDGVVLLHRQDRELDVHAPVIRGSGASLDRNESIHLEEQTTVSLAAPPLVPEPEDTGSTTPDAGQPDVPVPDVGPPDMGPPDAGTTRDVGPPDVRHPDNGVRDAGPPDSGDRDRPIDPRPTQF